LPDGRQGGFLRVAAKPGFVVGTQGFAIDETEKGGAVRNFGRQLRLVQLPLGDRGEPVAEGLAILRSVKPEQVGGSVDIAVAGIEEVGHRNDHDAIAPA
jgi:hypothetical protein